MTVNIKDLIVTLNKEIKSVMTLRIMTQNIMTIRIKYLLVILSKKQRE